MKPICGHPPPNEGHKSVADRFFFVLSVWFMTLQSVALCGLVYNFVCPVLLFSCSTTSESDCLVLILCASFMRAFSFLESISFNSFISICGSAFKHFRSSNGSNFLNYAFFHCIFLNFVEDAICRNLSYFFTLLNQKSK